MAMTAPLTLTGFRLDPRIPRALGVLGGRPRRQAPLRSKHQPSQQDITRGASKECTAMRSKDLSAR